MLGQIQAVFYAQVNVPRHYFYTINVVDGLAMWYVIVVNNTHDIDEGDKHYLDLCFRRANFFGREDAGAFTACFAI